MQDNLLRALRGLDLAPGASWSEITARYRQLAKTWHPDRFRSLSEKIIAEEKLKELNAFKEILEEHYLGPEHSPGEECACRHKAEPRSDARSEAKPKPPPDSTQPSDSSPPPQPPPPPRSANQKPGADKKQSTAKTKSDCWDWADELCRLLDIGELDRSEPPWLETMRRMSEKFVGKHPGDTIEDIWQKPISLTKERKRKGLIYGLIIAIIFDKIVAATASTPEQSTNPSSRQQQIDPVDSAPSQIPASPSIKITASPPVNYIAAPPLENTSQPPPEITPSPAPNAAIPPVISPAISPLEDPALTASKIRRILGNLPGPITDSANTQ